MSRQSARMLRDRTTARADAAAEARARRRRGACWYATRGNWEDVCSVTEQFLDLDAFDALMSSSCARRRLGCGIDFG